VVVVVVVGLLLEVDDELLLEVEELVLLEVELSVVLLDVEEESV